MLIDAVTKRMDTMTKRNLTLSAIFLVTLVVTGPVVAEIPEPDHLFWGKATYFGQDLNEGEVTVTINDDPTVLAKYEIGSRPELGPQFVLRVPLDSLGPRLPNSARVGDLARFYINGEVAGQKTIGSRGSVTRLDIDPDAASLRIVDIGDAQLVEGDAGTQEMIFTVTMSEAADFDVTVSYTTANETATIADNDYEPENGVAEFAAGDTEATLSVTINGDETIEPDETFLVNLTETSCSGLAGCTDPDIGDSHGTGTILDDDTPPSISVSDVTITESEATVQAVFRVSLSHVWDQDVSVAFATADGTAEAGTDYLSNSGVATVTIGSLVETVVVDVLSDEEDEEDETFFLNLSGPVGGSLLDAQGVATILDDQNFLVYRGQQHNGTEGVQGLDGPWGVAVSPDGEHLYAVSETDFLVLFKREETTGDLTFVEALQDGVNGIDGLDGARDVAVSTDGKFVYVVSSADDSIAVFERNIIDGDPDFGKLTPKQLISNGQSQNSQTVDGLEEPSVVLLSPDPDGAGMPELPDTHVYVIGKGENAVGADVGSIAVFERNAATGELTFVEVEVDGIDDTSDFGPAVSGLLGASDVAISPDGAHVYVTGGQADSVALFQRDLNSAEPALFGRLTYLESYTNGVGSPLITALEGASSISVSPDGLNVYATGRGADGGVAHFARNGDDGDSDYGELSFVGATAATPGNGLLDVVDCRISFDGRVFYAASFNSAALPVFSFGPSGDLEFIEVKKDGTGGVNGLSGAVRLAVSPDDRHIYVSGTFDDAVAIFVRDLDAPNDPTSLISTSHPVGDWSGNPVIGIAWTGAVDQGHAGLAGYSFLFDTAPATLPDDVIDLEHTSDAHGTNSAALAEGVSHYFHLRTCDTVGNCTTTLHIGPFMIDLSPPTNPTSVVSDSHLVNEPSENTRITMRWSGAADTLSGVAGYGYRFVEVGVGGSAPPPQCTGVEDVEHLPGDIVVESGRLFNGRYFFQLCTQDEVGNWSAGIVPLGPFIIETSDAAPPIVSGINTIASLEDMSLDLGEAVSTTVTQIVVSFNESMYDPVSPLHPNSVRNISNFRLLAPGGNASFETATCGAAGGDDVVVSVDTVVYDEPTFSAALVLNSRFALPPSDYRLVICDELADESGNLLDGDRNDVEGGDIVLDFEITSFNSLLNPNLDIGDLSFWIDTPEGTSDVAPGFDVDIGNAFNSNSVAIDVISASLGLVFGVSQCVAFDSATGEFQLSGWVLMTPDSGTDPTALGTVKFFTGDLCDDAQTGDEQETNRIVGDTGAFWSALLLQGTAPVDAASALVSFVTERPDDTAVFEAFFDDLYFGTLRVTDPTVFRDGFESGDFTNWSAVSP